MYYFNEKEILVFFSFIRISKSIIIPGPNTRTSQLFTSSNCEMLLSGLVIFTKLALDIIIVSDES